MGPVCYHPSPPLDLFLHFSNPRSTPSQPFISLLLCSYHRIALLLSHFPLYNFYDKRSLLRSGCFCSALFFSVHSSIKIQIKMSSLSIIRFENCLHYSAADMCFMCFDEHILNLYLTCVGEVAALDNTQNIGCTNIFCSTAHGWYVTDVHSFKGHHIHFVPIARMRIGHR